MLVDGMSNSYSVGGGVGGLPLMGRGCMTLPPPSSVPSDRSKRVCGGNTLPTSRPKNGCAHSQPRPPRIFSRKGLFRMLALCAGAKGATLPRPNCCCSVKGSGRRRLRSRSRSRSRSQSRDREVRKSNTLSLVGFHTLSHDFLIQPPIGSPYAGSF